MNARRSLLFVPGSRPERFGKALAAGADMVCVDLEDAVAPAHKAEARTSALPFLTDTPGPERLVRINSVKSAEGLRDLLAVIDARPSGGSLMLPKVDHAEEVRWAAALLTEAGLCLSLVALVETAEGLENAAAIAASSPFLKAVMFGGADLSAELGTPLAHEPLLYARSRLVHAAARAGIEAIDVPHIDVSDLEACRAETETARSLGFTAKACIHPTQVAVVNGVFTPGPEEVARARRIVEALEANPHGVLLLDGKLVEKPVVRAAQRVLARAQQSH
ncbi:MAG TPA: CoA ester lyase [Azospirillaceae bacterium]|nr:CoA ester lyase [Azospirillaceae bacterium]